MSDAAAAPLQPGNVAPDFSLFATPDQTLSLAELKRSPSTAFGAMRLSPPSGSFIFHSCPTSSRRAPSLEALASIAKRRERPNGPYS